MTMWNTDPTFAHLHCGDTGNIRQQVYSSAPGGAASWGLEGWTFEPHLSRHQDEYLDWQHYVSSGDGLYLYGKEERGRLGFVRCIQGNVWPHPVAQPPPWHVPGPLPIQGNTLMVHINVHHDTSHLGRSGQGWVMHAINVWLSSPNFPPKPHHGDINGRKPLVLDLAFGHTSQSGGLQSHESGTAFHYQERVGSAPLKVTKPYYFNLSQYLTRALGAFAGTRGKADVQLYQLEYVIEVRDAEGAATINQFWLQF
jgi:hypothetical protein